MRPRGQYRFIALIFAVSLAAPHAAWANTTASPVPTVSATASPADAAIMTQAKAWLTRLQSGHVDKAARTQLDDQVNALLTPSTVQAVAAKFGPLGAPQSFTFVGKQAVQGNMAYVYRVVFKSATLNEVFVLNKEGKISGIQFPPAK